MCEKFFSLNCLFAAKEDQERKKQLSDFRSVTQTVIQSLIQVGKRIKKGLRAVDEILFRTDISVSLHAGV